MKRTMFSSLIIIAVLALTFSVALAGNPFDGETSTASGYPTWDSDMINVEQVSQTGAGVYVAVLDTGLVPNWRDYFPEERIATDLGTGFDQPVTFKAKKTDPCGLDVAVGQLHQTTWVGSTGSTHGTHVASTIIGYFYRSNSDAAAGYPLPPIVVRGIAPGATIIPVKVLADYQVPALPKCTNPGPLPAEHVVFGTSEMVAAGIDYVTDLAIAGYRPMVINMSLGGDALEPVEKAAIDRAIANGVIVVASAGNEGEAGMGYPGAYAPVISAGASGWTREWLNPNGTLPPPRYRLWWLQSGFYPFTDIPESTPVDQVYVTDFSSRQLAGQQLDVLAPGSWVRGPFPGVPGFSHLPWWSKGIGDLVGGNPGNFYYVGGTSMSAPHVTSAAALLLEENPLLTQAQVESILKGTALPIPPGNATVYDLSPVPGFYTYTWGTNATGAGLLQVGAALALP
ncbi:MAG TPA: S8 family serine peptidase [Anaerolineales bacterium]|nr:S8 family serine peptidase [Anaerolineales bacterium]